MNGDTPPEIEDNSPPLKCGVSMVNSFSEYSLERGAEEQLCSGNTWSYVLGDQDQHQQR